METGGIGAPVSGGGGVSRGNAGGRERLGVCGSLGSRLGTNVAGLSRKKKSQAGFVDQLSAALTKCEELRMNRRAIDRDAASYDAVDGGGSSYHKECAGTREGEESHAKGDEGAAEVPLQVAERAV